MSRHNPTPFALDRCISLLVIGCACAIQVTTAAPLELGSTEAPECPMPYRRVGSACLYFHTSGTGTWYDLQSVCEDLRGRLVKIDDANLLHDIFKFINNEHLSPGNYWIGASDDGHEGDWRWTDGSSVKMGTPFWGTVGGSRPQPQEPRGGTKENCVDLPKDFLFLFHDNNCSIASFSGICEFQG